MAMRALYDHPGFAPVEDELTGVPLTICGSLPRELDGLFLRNGTNPLFAQRRRHMFDGEAMLHQVEIRKGEARYSNCIVRTPRTKQVMAAGRNRFIGFGELTGGGRGALVRLLGERLKVRLGLLPAIAPLHNVASSTAVLHHGDRLYGLQETGLPFAFDVARDDEGWLRISGDGRIEDFDGSLAVPFSAHPKTDAANDEVHSVGHDILSGVTHHSVLRQGGVRSREVARAAIAPFFVHDSVLTDRFVIFSDSSLRFNPKGLAGPNASVATFDRAHPMRFGIIPRDGGELRWFETAQAGHIWHIVNGWEEGEQAIVIVAPVFRDYPADVPIHTPHEPPAELTRWRLDLVTGTVTDERVLLADFHERPGINPAFAGKPSRFAWLLDQSGGTMGSGVLKYDLAEERGAGRIDYGEFHGGEPLFVPRADAAAEDDGWLIDLITTESEAALIVIDAVTMVEQCRILQPRRVPFGVHALWIDRAATDQLTVTAEHDR